MSISREVSSARRILGPSHEVEEVSLPQPYERCPMKLDPHLVIAVG